MRLKSVIKYSISEMKNSMLIFYGVIAAILVLINISFTNAANNIDGSISGLEMASVIFLFVVGLNSFKHNYLFLLTNGITRKAQFYGFIISSFMVAIVMAAIDTVYTNIVSSFISYSSLFSQAYEGLVTAVSKPLFILMGFAWSIALYLFAVVLGYFITTLYYRMSKLLKITVSIGVPAILFTVAVIDAVANNGRVLNWINNLFTLLSGLKNGNVPFIAVISLLIGTIIFAGLAYLLVRRAPVKE